MALAGWAYPRLRPGVREMIALTAGYFGVVTGFEASYYALPIGPSGEWSQCVDLRAPVR